MARTWLSIRVDLVAGRGENFWPRPGRLFAAARSHSFSRLAAAINLAFARWDLAHMHSFTVADGTGITQLELWDGEAPDGSLDSYQTKLSRLAPGEQFAYSFDFGDDWVHLCTVGAERIDPYETVGLQPSEPTPYLGWGNLPDQHGRRWDTDDGGGPEPKRPRDLLADLPALLPWWGPRPYGE
jgi:hypothetical protein